MFIVQLQRTACQIRKDPCMKDVQLLFTAVVKHEISKGFLRPSLRMWKRKVRIRNRSRVPFQCYKKVKCGA